MTPFLWLCVFWAVMCTLGGLSEWWDHYHPNDDDGATRAKIAPLSQFGSATG